MIKILIVDDEKAICDLIDLNLSTSGYHCKAVQNGLEAIDLIEKENFDLVSILVRAFSSALILCFRGRTGLT